MDDLGTAAMHRLSRGNNAASKMVRNPLVPEAYAEQGNFGFGNHSRRHAEISRIFGAPGAWRNNHAVEIKPLDFFPRHLIVSHHDGRAPGDLRDGVHQVECE